MNSISFRHILVACAAVGMLGFAIPSVHALAIDGAAPRADVTRDTTSRRAPTAPPVQAEPVQAEPVQAEPMQNNSCGDGRCSPPEDCNTCARDCGSCCGDRRCAPPEDCRSCPGDCGSC